MKKISILLFLFILTGVSLFAASSKVFMLRDNGPLRIENDTNGVEWAATVRAGTELELESDKLVKKDLITSKETYPDVDFYKVKYQDKIYYVQESDVEPAEKLSVIQKDTVLFSRPTLSSFRNALLETGSFVVTGKTVTEFSKSFTEITFYDTIDYVKRTRYVSSNDISNSDKDIKAIILLENARVTESEDLQKELLDNAKSMKTSEIISNYINSEIAKILNVSSFSDDSIITIDQYSCTVTTTDGSKVNVRSLPGTAGEVIGQFESVNSPAVLVTMKTEGTETIDGITESWYYVIETDKDTFEPVTGGIEGWIFGAFLE